MRKRLREEGLSAFLDTAPCGIVVLNDDGEILFVNGTLGGLIGCEPEALNGEHIGGLLGPGGLLFMETHLFPLLRLQGRAEEVYLTLRTHEDRDLPILLSAVRRVQEEGGIIDCVVLPMERRYRFEDYLVQAKKMTQSANLFLEAQIASRTDEIRRLAVELSLTEQRERESLARTLHDTVQQELYAVQFALARLRKSVEGEAVTARLNDVEKLLRGAMQMTREVTTDLKPAVLDDSDVGEILQWLARSMHDKYGLQVRVICEGHCCIETESVRMLLFRLARELLFNVVKHAEVNEATVTVSVADDEVVLRVEDEGRGFDPLQVDETDAGTGLGLSGIYKRMQLYGGTIAIDADTDRGTRVTLALPVATQA